MTLIAATPQALGYVTDGESENEFLKNHVVQAVVRSVIHGERRLATTTPKGWLSCSNDTASLSPFQRACPGEESPLKRAEGLKAYDPCLTGPTRAGLRLRLRRRKAAQAASDRTGRNRKRSHEPSVAGNGKEMENQP